MVSSPQHRRLFDIPTWVPTAFSQLYIWKTEKPCLHPFLSIGFFTPVWVIHPPYRCGLESLLLITPHSLYKLAHVYVASRNVEIPCLSPHPTDLELLDTCVFSPIKEGVGTPTLSVIWYHCQYEGPLRRLPGFDSTPHWGTWGTFFFLYIFPHNTFNTTYSFLGRQMGIREAAVLCAWSMPGLTFWYIYSKS